MGAWLLSSGLKSTGELPARQTRAAETIPVAPWKPKSRTWQAMGRCAREARGTGGRTDAADSLGWIYFLCGAELGVGQASRC